jgi:RNA polymerase sigma factor (sigma-70 family)
MTGNVSLQALLATQKTGQPEHFRALYDLLVDKLYAYVRYRVNTPEVATDIVQDVFIDLHSALPTFTYTTDAQFYSFVFLITKRKLAKHYSESKVKQVSEVALQEDILAAPSPHTEEEDAVQRALAALEPDTREIVVLHHWSRYTFPEIASLLDMTESAVRVRHHRALKTLAATLSSTL